MQDFKSLTSNLENIFLFFHHLAEYFWLHCLRANYVTGILKRSIPRNPEIPESQNYRWAAEGRIHLVKEMFPDDFNEILVSDEYDEEDINQWGKS